MSEETYARVKGEWVYLYWAADRDRKTLGFRLSKRRNKAAPTRVFASASPMREGIEMANMIRKGQITPGRCPFDRFAVLAA